MNYQVKIEISKTAFPLHTFFAPQDESISKKLEQNTKFSQKLEQYKLTPAYKSIGLYIGIRTPYTKDLSN